VVKQIGIAGRDAAAIATSLERAIIAGTYAPDAALPPIRTLAATLRVSPVTVAAAYRRLHDRGLVTAGGRRGTRVRSHPVVALPGAALRVDAGVTDLVSGNPDPDLLPPLEPLLRTVALPSASYGDPPVLPALEAFAADEFAADGIPAGPMTVCHGALDAIERLLREWLRPGDRVGVEDPTLPALLDLLGASGLGAQPIPVDDDGPQTAGLEDALARGARAVIVTPRAQNPTGAALSAARAVELQSVLRAAKDVLIVENDPAGPVSGAPARTMTTDAHPRWAVVRSVSKFLGPDLRVALVIGDAVTMARVQRRQAVGVRWVSRLLQQIALSAWSDPSSGRRLAHAADAYAQRRNTLIQALAQRDVEVSCRSGFNVWIPVREETATVQALARRGWAVAAGERFRLRSGPGIRVTTSALDARSAERFAADCAAALRRSGAASA
jgi:DNA-binding transcriptional MocR family regulator